MNNTFQNYNLPSALLGALARMQYDTPTAIQDQVIPVALTGQDILGSSKTGSGKTAAFSIPVVAQLMNEPGAKVLVLAPTRELAEQVEGVMSTMASGCKHLRTALLIGGEPIGKQLMRLRSHPNVIVGTPGRVEDHLYRGSLHINDTSFLILDEIDRMLDMGFSIQIDKIIKRLPVERQTLMFSATLDRSIEKLARAYLKDPARINIEIDDNEEKNIKEECLYVSESDKFDILVKQLNEREGSIIVFVKTQIKADDVCYQLQEANYNAQVIHGGLKQYHRKRVIEDFRNQRYSIIVATDVAARGLDIDHIKHVINYDFPQTAEDYTHRIGRTGRAGATGFAFSMIASSQEKRLWSIIHNEPVERETRRPLRREGEARPNRLRSSYPFTPRKDYSNYNEN
ncbi:DEAD/DEAH box helicase [Cardinium endosymbiont of Culicoides punctatus]|uniref:DEAD/DEAH box helicase n=1 Tax=Cardinium endosymbiont of Culicoides punctatus TaxID=2304601 RepID=UPI001058BE5F|nr:DEAD/DEAH box helicase [Cardinium endosymbiont of Culicoides punctatus]TDG95649.1 DEAD-box ATP-dependent RNA helicase CshA [Cardinium endosymbiont of Culicoides punctatus]